MLSKRMKSKSSYETVINKSENEFQNTLNFFPIGLIVLDRENDSKDYKIKIVNSYIFGLLDIPKNLNMKIFKERLEDFKQWENNHLTEINLKEIIFNYKEYKNFQSGTFISSLSMIYVKIKIVKKNIFICMDNYNDEKKGIQNNLIKSLKYQYIVTLYHELNNPLNALQNIIEENLNDESQMEENSIDKSSKKNNINLLVNLIKVFIDNFIWYFKIIFDNSKNLIINLKSKINLEFQFTNILNHFCVLFEYKEIQYTNDFSFLKDKYIESNENYLDNFLRGVYILLYHKIPRSSGFILKFNNLSNNKVKLIFEKLKINNQIQNRKSRIINDIDFGFKEEFDFSKTVQTIEMTKELLQNISEVLNLKMKIYDEEDNIILTIILPYSIEEDEDEEINEFQNKQNEKIFEVMNRKLIININDNSKYFDNVTSHINQRNSSNIFSSSSKNFQLYNIKINDDDLVNNNNNSKQYEKLDIISLDDKSIMNIKSFTNLKSNINNSEILKDSIFEINPTKTTKIKRKTFTYEDSLNIGDKLKRDKNSYFAVGKLNNQRLFFNNENYENNLKEVPLYHNKITGKTSTRENSRFEKRTSQFSTFEKKNSLQNNNKNTDNLIEKKKSYHKNYNTNSNNGINKTFNNNNNNNISNNNNNNNNNTSNINTFNNNLENNNIKNIKICHCRDILLCDDETFNLKTIKNMLKKLNIECDTSTNGKECIDSIINKKKLKCNCNKNYYKLIFLDMMMPIMNGLEAVKIIQKMIDENEINNDIKIIIISAHIEENLLKELKKINCIIETIKKPLKKNKLNEILNNYYFRK